jgi:hypothetical protein
VSDERTSSLSHVLKDWLPIVFSALALVVSIAVLWDQRREAQPRLNLRAIAGYSERGCPSITLFVTNESSRAITIAPPFVSDLRERTERERASLLEPLPFFVSLAAKQGRTRQPDGGPLFLRPDEAMEFEHTLSARQRRLLRADSLLVAAVTDYTGNFWSATFEEQSPVQTALEILREPCV